MQMLSKGFGTYKIASLDCLNSILSAVEIGYRHFDFASFYENQPELGEAFKKVF